MSKARHLGNLLDTDGDVISSSLDNVDTSSFIEKINWQHNAGTVGTFNETASIGTINVGAVSGLSGSIMTATSNDLPAGLSLSAAGALTGTHPNITATTTSTFNVSVTDGTNNASREYTITNTADNDAPVWNTASGALTAGSAAAYSVQLSATEPEGGSLTYSLVSGSLPNSLSMNSSGLISGTPSADGTFNFTISVTDGTTPVSRSFSIAVTLWQGMAATGGTVTTDGDYKVHTFNSSGNFQITTLGTDAVVEYLVVAGGGSGGSGGGGGGAGGYRYGTGFSMSNQTYAITVGAGGTAGAFNLRGANGANSVFSTITSAGGGAAGTDGVGPIQGVDGGSGGGSGSSGGAAAASGGGSGNTPSTTPSQGNNGGHGHTGSPYRGGGGGGMGSAGQNASAGSAGGAASNISGIDSTYRAGGGGAGGGHYGGSSGGAGSPAGGSTAGVSSGTATSATANTGSGAGGSRMGIGGNGGSGVVIIKYKFQ